MKLSLCGATFGLLAVTATGALAQPRLADVDRDYLTKDAQGSVYDQATAQLAAQRARSTALHRYGLQLIADHARLNQTLMTLARSKGVVLPVVLTDTDQTKLVGFSRLSADKFDRAIIAEFVRINGDDVRDGVKELQATRDPQVRRAVTQFVATERKHLREARALQRQIGR